MTFCYFQNGLESATVRGLTGSLADSATASAAAVSQARRRFWMMSAEEGPHGVNLPALGSLAATMLDPA